MLLSLRRKRERHGGAGCAVPGGEQELPVVLPGDVADYLQTKPVLLRLGFIRGGLPLFGVQHL